MKNQTFGQRLLANGGKLISEIEGEFLTFRIIQYKGRRVIIHRYEYQNKWHEIVYEVKAMHNITNATEEEKEALRCEIPDEAIPPFQIGTVILDEVDDDEKVKIISLLEEEDHPRAMSAN